MELALSPLRHFADFQGRTRRLEFWLFLTLNVTCLVLLAVLAGAVNQVSATAGTFMSMVMLLIWLALFIPTLAVMVRRFHDQGHSGWFVLLNFVPGIGGVLVLIFMCLPGTAGDNRYGADPKMSEL